MNEKNFFTVRASNMSDADFKHFKQVMCRTFNFICALEDMGLKEVNDLQNTPKEYNISMSSKELMETFKNLFNIDIE